GVASFLVAGCGSSSNSSTPGQITPPTSTSTAPSITTQPASVSVNSGQTATFSVIATGTTPLNYQWAKNGMNISGATSASYTTPATVSGDTGATFTVTVSNSVGSVTSTPATLTVTVASTSAPVISQQTLSQAVTLGQPATFSVAATGAAPLSYQWQLN